MVEAIVRLLIIITTVLAVSKMVQVPNYPGMLPRCLQSVSFFSTNIRHFSCVLTSFGASTLRIVGSVEPISISSFSGENKVIGGTP